MSDIALIFNIPSAYREPIYRLIDSNFNCEWYFSDLKSDVKLFDISILKQAKIVKVKSIFKFNWYDGIINLYKRKDLEKFLIIGEPYNFSIWLLCILIRIFKPKKRIYFWTHGWYGKESKLKKLLKKIFFKLADKLFLYGNYAKQLMIKEGFKEENLIVIYNSLNYEKQIELRKACYPTEIYKQKFGNNNSTLIFIGRLTRVKKIELLLQAVAKLKEEGKEYNLVLIGSGEEEKYLKELAEDLQLDNQVWFYGACYDEAKNAELIYNADLCVSPGNVGLTAIHSMMFGTPVITHNDFKWQMPEFEIVEKGKTGEFFENDNFESLSDVIDKWFKNPFYNREIIRKECYNIIDSDWNPNKQFEIFSTYLN